MYLVWFHVDSTNSFIYALFSHPTEFVLGVIPDSEELKEFRKPQGFFLRIKTLHVYNGGLFHKSGTTVYVTGYEKTHYYIYDNYYKKT